MRNWVRIYSVAVLLASAIVASAAALKAQSPAESISVEASPQIFATMCSRRCRLDSLSARIC